MAGNLRNSPKPRSECGPSPQLATLPVQVPAAGLPHAFLRLRLFWGCRSWSLTNGLCPCSKGLGPRGCVGDRSLSFVCGAGTQTSQTSAQVCHIDDLLKERIALVESLDAPREAAGFVAPKWAYSTGR